MTYEVIDDSGVAMDAHFELDGPDIVFHSRGGSKANGDALNSDYNRALRILLSRIAASQLQIEGAWLDSSRVQNIPLDQRVLLTPSDPRTGAEELAALLANRMKNIGRDNDARGPGNATRRIRIQVTDSPSQEDFLRILGGRLARRDVRSRDRLPADELRKVTPEHLWKAIEKLREGFLDHKFHLSREYDLIADGERFDPKTVFGIAASEALGFEVLPRHFSGGVGTVCFTILETGGYEIVPKDQLPQAEVIPPLPEDREWVEGSLRLSNHLKRERASGLARAKRAAFVREHGRLFCERCKMDPSDVYGELYGDACIEVHHRAVHVAEMITSHTTRLDDLQCLCANCHRVVHRELKG